MRWFKRKPTPFDDYFSVKIETPDNPRDDHHFTWSVPDWYYAHLLCLQFTVDLFNDPLDILRWYDFFVERGGVRIYSWSHLKHLEHGNLHYATQYPHALTVGLYRGGLAPVVPPHNPWQQPLPIDLFLYPFDVLHVQILNPDNKDALSDFRLTLRSWEIS